ncbi:hypothetical protein NPIL_212211 [Nephila pilipes]|uniref:Uncharacterized protein n=1 Tax=Nephila pilipes TaxID=299642 RepID=A0A8X6QIP4_NEPPI|nr:hypothetical protein NPIL_212211 [Nephila pilipes]
MFGVRTMIFHHGKLFLVVSNIPNDCVLNISMTNGMKHQVHVENGVSKSGRVAVNGKTLRIDDAADAVRDLMSANVCDIQGQHAIQLIREGSDESVRAVI